MLNCAQTGAVEATDLQMEVRHMDMEYSTIRYSDKPYTTYGTSGPRAVHPDGRDRARREAIEVEPVLMGIVNPNSPLRDFDRRSDRVGRGEAAHRRDPVPVGGGDERQRAAGV